MSSVTNNNSLQATLLENEVPSSALNTEETKTNEVALNVAEQPQAQPAAPTAQPKKSFCKKVGDNLDGIAFGIFVAAMVAITQGFGLGSLV